MDAIPEVSITRVGLTPTTLRTPPKPQVAPTVWVAAVQQSPTNAAMHLGRAEAEGGDAPALRHCTRKGIHVGQLWQLRSACVTEV